MTHELWGEETAKIWERFRPPSRPSESELAIYERYIKALPPGAVSMLMGSTPEIRDIFSKERKKVHVVDWSENNYMALKSLMKEKDICNELFAKMDWRTMKPDMKFDFIIGDLAFLVMTRSDSIKSMWRTMGCLKEDGASIQRMWVRNHTEPYPIERILQLYNHKPDSESLWSWLELPMIFHDYNYEKEEFIARHCHETMQRHVKQKRLPEEILKTFDVFKYFNAPLNIPLKSDFERSLLQHFHIQRIEYGADHFAENAPIYLLKQLG